MSENRHEKCKSMTLEGLCGDNCSISKDGLNGLAYKHVRVEEGEAFVPASEYELGVDHLLTGRKYESILEDDFIYMNSADTEKYLALEDFPSAENFGGINTDFGISNIEVAQGPGEMSLQLPDSMLQNDDDDQCRHVMENLYSDYISESGFAGNNSYLEEGLHGRYCLRNLSSDHSQILEVDSDVDEILNLTKTINLKTDSKSDLNALCLGNMNIHEIHDAFRSTHGRGTSITDKQWLKQHVLSGSSSGIDADDTPNNMRSRTLLDENKDVVLFSTSNQSEASCASLTCSLDQKASVGEPVNERLADKDSSSASVLDTGKFRVIESEGGDCASMTRKRMRKPTRRYIEESAEVKSRLCNDNLGSLSTSPQERIFRVGIHETTWKRAGLTQMVSEKSSALSYIVRPRRGRPRKNVKTSKGKKGHIQNAVDHKTICDSVLSRSENDDILESTRSDNCGVRRKHHRLWTLTEVTKLVEGVSRYGVGRWTEIKRLLFSSSVYRTSVDLKDKWRNLLKASGSHPFVKRELETRKKQSTGPVPQSVLRRVRDLAEMHPYPRERKSRTSSLLSATPTISNDTTTLCNKRAVHMRSPTSSA